MVHDHLAVDTYWFPVSEHELCRNSARLCGHKMLNLKMLVKALKFDFDLCDQDTPAEPGSSSCESQSRIDYVLIQKMAAATMELKK